MNSFDSFEIRILAPAVAYVDFLLPGFFHLVSDVSLYFFSTESCHFCPPAQVRIGYRRGKLKCLHLVGAQGLSRQTQLPTSIL